MKIIIVGAGEVGYNIAHRLAAEDKNVVIIDKNPDAVRRISEDLDAEVITASGSNPEVLIDAGIRGADILLAVTDSDETNLAACLMADLISPTTRKLARIRTSEFDPYHSRLKEQCPHIDTIINPETEVVKTIKKLMDAPEAVDIGDFVEGQVKYAGIRMERTSALTGMKLIDFPSKFPDARPLIAAIIRNNEVIVPRGTDRLKSGDLIYFVCESSELEKMLELFGKKSRPAKSALIVGGGRTGEHLGQILEQNNIKTRIIESDINRCRYLARKMNNCVILHGDGSDQKLFIEENAGSSDVVVAVTNDDETNILVSMLAKNMGVGNTITRITKSSYFPLLATLGIDKVVSPRLSAVSSILHNVRKGKILSDISISGEQGEFIEAIALETSDITDRPLKKISFPKGSILVCVVRHGKIIIPSGNSVVKPDDRIIMFAVRKAVKKLEKLLTVKLDFF